MATFFGWARRIKRHRFFAQKNYLFVFKMGSDRRRVASKGPRRYGHGRSAEAFGH